jgi:dTMP kinase
MLSLKRGILIAIEGIDGSGKSTLARAITSLLSTQQLPIVLTKEPGGTELGASVRAMLQEKPVPISARTEFLLFAADRAQHMEQFVRPHLEKKYIVISDRMGDSSLVYQGYGRGLDKTMIKTINAWAMNNIQPDLIMYVKVDLGIALSRIIARNDKLTSFEQEKKEFFQRLIDGFDQIYATRTDVIHIDGNQSAQQCAHDAYTKIVDWVNKSKLL